MELNEDEGKAYREAVIAASNKDGAWVHIVYVPTSLADRFLYPAKQFIDKRAGLQDATKRIGTIKNFLNERGQSVECVAYAAAHQGVLINDHAGESEAQDDLDYAIGSNRRKPDFVTPDVDANVANVKHIVSGIDMANGEDYTAPVPFAPYVPRKKRGSGNE
jgi:CO dehydrogenase/acetyl-CoA synthase beta subunit